jgi:hypothetical protein
MRCPICHEEVPGGGHLHEECLQIAREQVRETVRTLPRPARKKPASPEPLPAPPPLPVKKRSRAPKTATPTRKCPICPKALPLTAEFFEFDPVAGVFDAHCLTHRQQIREKVRQTVEALQADRMERIEESLETAAAPPMRRSPRSVRGSTSSWAPRSAGSRRERACGSARGGTAGTRSSTR